MKCEIVRADCIKNLEDQINEILRTVEFVDIKYNAFVNSSHCSQCCYDNDGDMIFTAIVLFKEVSGGTE